MKHVTLLAAAAAALATMPVHADPQTGNDWTGFYVGGQVGWMDVEYPTSNPIPGGILFDGNGAALGLHAGYNHDFGALVLGAEVSVDFPSEDLELTPAGTSAPREIDYFAVAKIKGGYDAGRFLPYAVIGYAWQDFEDTGNPTTRSQTFEGLAYGLGVSFLASPRLIAGIEALWFDLDPDNSTSTLTSEGTLLSLRMSYAF